MKEIFKFTLTPGTLKLADVRKMYHHKVFLTLDPQSIPKIEESCHYIQKIIQKDQSVYGVNTGFGQLAQTRIPMQDLQVLQRSLVLSHAAGIGEPLCDNLVRLILILKINALSLGFSGVRKQVIQALIQLVNKEIYPCIPLKGSVGASGDLAPLAHMSLVLLGEGKARYQGQWIDAKQALSLAELKPFHLEAKEGLALLNGTQVSTAYALKGLFEAENVLASAIICGSLSGEALLASRVPFDARIHRVRGQPCQEDVAKAYLEVLEKESEISRMHKDSMKVQDPYSLRCQPQVMGACLLQIRNAADVLEKECNAVSDNPLIFVNEGDILSGGNFHAEIIAMASDNLALAIAEIGSLSERRIALMVDSNMSQLPAFLVNNAGVNSGFMIAHVTAAALVSENKALAHAHSIDSLPTSANQEDHVSMAPNAGKRLWEMTANVRGILAIEWLSACQGMDLRSQYKSSPKLEQARKILRDHVPFYEKDRFFAPDIEIATKLIEEEKLAFLLTKGLLPSLS